MKDSMSSYAVSMCSWKVFSRKISLNQNLIVFLTLPYKNGSILTFAFLSFRAQPRVSPYCHLLTTGLNPHPLRRRCSISFLNCRLREPTSSPSCLQEAYTSGGPSQPHPLRHKMKDPEMTMSRRVNLAVAQAKRALNVVKMGLLPP